MAEIRYKQFNKESKDCLLGQICSEPLSYGMGAAAIQFNGDYKYIRITDIDDETRSFINEDPTSPDEVPDERYYLKESDIVFARTGASVGKSYRYKNSDGKLVYAGFLIRARIDLTKANQNYIFGQTLTNKYNKWVKVMSTRSGQPGINADEYSSMPIKLVDKEEQDLIGSFLEKLEKQIELANQEIEAWRTIKDNLVEQLIYKSGFKRAILSSLVEKKHKVEKDCVGYIEISDVIPNENRYLFVEAKELAAGAKKAEEGCILVSTVRPTRGAICTLNQNSYVSGAFLQLYPKAGVNRDYLLFAISSYRFLHKMGSFSTGSTYPTIDKDDILSFEIPVPETSIQNDIAEKINQIARLISMKVKKRDYLVNRRLALLDKLY